MHENWNYVSMDNIYLHKANYILWIGITTFYEKVITLYMGSFSKLVEFNLLNEFI